MWDWLRSGTTNQRQAFGQNLTPLARAALMDAIRRSLPEENRPQDFGSALTAGTFDQPGLLDLLLQRIRDKVPAPQQPSGGGFTAGTGGSFGG